MALIVNIEKTLGDFHLKVNFTAEREVMALLGASGCGKSMTLGCIAGIVRPDKGHIELNGRVLFDSEKKIDLPPQKRKVGCLFQQYALFPHMTVEQNIRAGAHTRPKNERESIVICGAYGRGNAGDDAILEAIVQEMRQLDPERTICVMSRRPKETRLIYRTNAIYTFNVFSVLRKFRHAALYINGGGSLMQDVTSTRSIWYYCYTLYAAKKRGCKVMMYGCGIGPINRPGNRRMAARTIDASVDRITLRDDNSRALLAEMGVTRPDIRVSADPTIILTPAPREIVNIALEQSGIDPNGKYIGFGLRNWKGLDTALPEIAAAANYAYEKHGLTPVFVPIEFPSDLMPAERVGALLHCPWHAVRTRQPIEVTIGILSRMKTVVGIRLHSLMFSAGQGVPVVGMSYDIKVDGFLKYIGSRTCLQLSSVKAEPLCRLIDECVSGALDNEVHRTAEMLRERESENVKGAAKLLNISEN